MQKHTSLFLLPPLPEGGEVHEKTPVAEDDTPEAEIQEQETAGSQAKET